MTALLAARDIYVAYGAVEAVRGVTLAVEAGQVIAVVGANGAGKSTIVRALSGELAPTRGEILYKDASTIGVSAFQMARKGVVQCPEGRHIFGSLTVLENLRLGAYGRAKMASSAAKLDHVFAIFPRLFERRAQFGGTLSGGEQQMLAIGRAMMAEPDVLLLDEPSLGLAPMLVRTMFDAISAINRGGTAVLLIEQNAFLALAAAHYAYVLQTGKVVLEGTGDELLKSKDTIHAYLG